MHSEQKLVRLSEASLENGEWKVPNGWFVASVTIMSEDEKYYTRIVLVLEKTLEIPSAGPYR